MSLHNQISKKSQPDATTTPHSPTTIAAQNTLDNSIDVLTLRTQAMERRQTSIALTEPTNINSMALLSSSTNALLALVRPGPSSIPAATFQDKSPCALTLQIGSSPGCLQVLEMERAQVRVDNYVDSEHASPRQSPSNHENLFEDEDRSDVDIGSDRSESSPVKKQPLRRQDAQRNQRRRQLERKTIGDV